MVSAAWLRRLAFAGGLALAALPLAAQQNRGPTGPQPPPTIPTCPNTRQELTVDGDGTVALSTGKFAIVNDWTVGHNINLPAASSYTDSAGNGCTLVIKDEDQTVAAARPATIVRAGTDTIDKGSTFVATTTGFSLVLRSNALPTHAGNGWEIDGYGAHQSYDCSPGEQFAQTESAAGATTCADPAAQLLYQDNLPLIIPSSGTMGANGALTALTALPFQFLSCYMYFPAGKVFSGSAAGFYYAVMTSTTAATVKNNVYVPGTPAVIPGSPLAVTDAGPGAYTQTTGNDIALVSTSIAANALGINGALRLLAQFEYANDANNKIIKANLGGTIAATFLSGGTSFLSYQATTSGRQPLLMVRNQAATNVQVSTNTLDTGPGAAAPVRGTIDTTASQNFILSGQLAVATDYIVLEGATLEKLH